MSKYPILNNDPQLLRIETEDDETEDLRYRTEKHYYENLLKSLKIDKEYYKKKYKSSNKKKVMLFITKTSIGSASTFSSSSLAFLNPSVGISISSSGALLISFADLITKEYISKLKIRFINIRD